eukprot:CAMPEP_0194395542 /NCGR_PEP_ID=MMETSP0174-20130528/124481_1 /TAXON_ID=216777 /ORGANISM="Proboscia alata, Strain PI-D3" /LENGTH=86 /DNA_ID=CAMNT_0039191489 /DNA_START=614 /DNA_END=874 /DNA_ORIENTATION=+
MAENLDKEEEEASLDNEESDDETRKETEANGGAEARLDPEPEIGEIPEFFKAEYSNILYFLHFASADSKTIHPIHLDPASDNESME